MSYLVKGHTGGGRRDFLDDKPVHCGTTLEWWDPETKKWDRCRYEMDGRANGYLILAIGATDWTHGAYDIELRWPPREGQS